MRAVGGEAEEGRRVDGCFDAWDFGGMVGERVCVCMYVDDGLGLVELS